MYTAGLCCYVLKFKFGLDVIKMKLDLWERRTLSPDTPTSAEMKSIYDGGARRQIHKVNTNENYLFITTSQRKDSHGLLLSKLGVYLRHV